MDKLFIIVWIISGKPSIVGAYTNYDTAENKINEMQRNGIQGFYRIYETEIIDG